MARSGRRRGGQNTREAILESARQTFHADGYTGATIRAIAAGAGVDPALVHHYFGTKSALFVAAMRLPIDPTDVARTLLTGDPSTLGYRMATLFFSIWEGTDTKPFTALIRSAMSHEDAARMLRELLTEELIGPVAGQLGTPNAELRANLVGTQMVGMAMLRYIIRLEPLASSDPKKLAEAIAPTLQRYFTGNIGEGSLDDQVPG